MKPPLVSKAASAKFDNVWLGGRVSLTDTHLVFGVNAAYRQVQPDADVQFPLTTVRSVEVRSGVLTRIVVVKTDDGPFEFRCYGADEVAETIRQTLPRTVGQA